MNTTKKIFLIPFMVTALLFSSGCKLPAGGIGAIFETIMAYITDKCDPALNDDVPGSCTRFASALEWIQLNEGAIIERLTVSYESGAYAELLGGAADYIESNGGLTDIWSGVVGSDGFTGDSLISDNDARVYFDKKNNKKSADINGDIIAKGGSEIYIAAGKFDTGASITATENSTISLYGVFDLNACGITDTFGSVNASTNGTGSCQVTGTLGSGDAIDVVITATENGTVHFFDISDFYHEAVDE